MSLKMILSPPSKPDDVSLEDHINSFLPETIRVWAVVRVQGAFNPRTMCDQRQYEYTMPTHVLLGPKPGSAMAEWLARCREAAKPSPAVTAAAAPGPFEAPAETSASSNLPRATLAAEAATSEFWSGRSQEGTFTEDLEIKRSWRITPDLLQSARDFVKQYEGSHNFYNFTVGKDFRDRSCQRTMRKLEVCHCLQVRFKQSH